MYWVKFSTGVMFDFHVRLRSVMGIIFWGVGRYIACFYCGQFIQLFNFFCSLSVYIWLFKSGFICLVECLALLWCAEVRSCQQYFRRRHVVATNGRYSSHVRTSKLNSFW